LEMSENMLYHILLCLVGLRNAHAFQVAGDCRGLLEGRSSWEGGDAWDMRAATMGSPDWSLLLQFDRPLQGLQVYNGVMETEDMKEFKIAPEQYLRHHKGPVDVNFLVNYEDRQTPANLKFINVNGKTHYCKGGLGEPTADARHGRITGPQFRNDPADAKLTSAIEDKLTQHIDTVYGEKAKAKSQVSCKKDSSAQTVCTRINTLVFEKAIAGGCPDDLMPSACKALKAGHTDNAINGCKKADWKEFMTKFCYNTCFCPI